VLTPFFWKNMSNGQGEATDGMQSSIGRLKGEKNDQQESGVYD
jgi:hypothetical protein